MPIGNPQDILTTPYGYSGQVAPETAVNLQNLNRRRLIANMLMQQGVQPAQGQMVGRFYVPPSLAQGFAGLGSAGLGALLAGDIDKKSSKAVGDDRQMVLEALEAYRNRQGQGGQPTPPQPAPEPDQPFTGQVGATPMPEQGVQSAAPPVTAPPPASQAGIEGMQGLDMANVQPADMSQMANSANPDMAQAQAASAQVLPQAEPLPAQPQAQGRPSFEQLADLMTHQHPQVRAYGQFLAQMQQKEQEREQQQSFLSQEKQLQREFMSGENAMNRDMQRDLVGSKLDQAMMMGLISKDQKDQMMAMQARQNELTGDLKKAEIGSRAQIAKQHDETLKAIAQTKQQSKGTIPASALKMQNEELDAIGAASSIQKDMASVRAQIESGKLQLGPVRNLIGQAKNAAGLSDENSRNLASFKATLERMRNESLRLNKGVQTEGDSVRAWKELVDNMNDPQVVKQRLAEIEAQNERAATLRKMNIDVIRQNFGAEPLDTQGYQSQSATVGAAKGQPATPQAGGPQVGIVEDGYRFKGGNPSDPKSWEKVN